jgi:hypothetical protein
MERLRLFLARFGRAWGLYRKLDYSWRVAWAKAAR